MIEFKSLLEALEYHPVCPLCQRVMTLDCKAWAIGRKGYLLFDINSPADLRIEIASHTITAVPNSKMGPYSPLGSTKCLSLTIDCSQCSMFGYTLFLVVGSINLKLINIALKSETVRWTDEHNNLHEVESIYDVHSKYTFFPSNKIDRRTTIPLIPINIHNPQETIDRARTLATFS